MTGLVYYGAKASRALAEGNVAAYDVHFAAAADARERLARRMFHCVLCGDLKVDSLRDVCCLCRALGERPAGLHHSAGGFGLGVPA